MGKTIKIHPSDNVEVCLSDVTSNGVTIKQGHKIALNDIKMGEQIIKYAEQEKPKYVPKDSDED